MWKRGPFSELLVQFRMLKLDIRDVLADRACGRWHKQKLAIMQLRKNVRAVFGRPAPYDRPRPMA